MSKQHKGYVVITLRRNHNRLVWEGLEYCGEAGDDLVE